MKQIIKRIPVVGAIARSIYNKWFNPQRTFHGSERYWVERYSTGGNSGAGSYGLLAEFKAEIINNFVLQNNIKMIIEYGCGDGNQLKLAEYPAYIGFDVSETAVANCRQAFANDTSKSFRLANEYNNEIAELTLSLDVIYHLIEDSIYSSYMDRLFDSSNRYVIIYASNTDVNEDGVAVHVKHRKFTDFVESMKPNWKLIQYLPNKYPFTGDITTGSFADFYIYEKIR